MFLILAADITWGKIVTFGPQYGVGQVALHGLREGTDLRRDATNPTRVLNQQLNDTYTERNTS